MIPEKRRYEEGKAIGIIEKIEKGVLELRL
jgi:hypothetical protein